MAEHFFYAPFAGDIARVGLLRGERAKKSPRILRLLPQRGERDSGVESIWPPKCGGGCQSLIKGKDFEHNVEAHESTCDTRPAG
jgi:hypothetical protein